ncbi:MAG: phosphoribosylformylglycinamidine synthase subunit PurS [Deltaproteobacteria bacterium]|nr:phosphoribosylformylglycinamidine synthase subunit PurS [Deltaproteobacteria bacterium]MCB9788855.1 phosphoribosylformylglycinamidine synthase subunit PurS [Deltaproteobacteria bacterium]
MAFLARIYVTPRADVLDPQGNAVAHGLHSLGFGEVTEVRIGRYLEVRIGGSDRAAATEQVTAMCERLLANTVVEDFRFELDALASDR